MLGRRLKILLIFVFTWAAFISLRLFYHTVYARDHYLDEGVRHAWRCGTIPSARGKVFDSNGVLLAWTQRQYDLVVENSPSLFAKGTDILARLKRQFPDMRPDDDGNLVRKNLSMTQIQSLRNDIALHPEIRIAPRLERRHVDYREVRNYLGGVGTEDGRLAGKAGIEKEYDAELAGTDGVYTVMLDRRKNWVPGTWKVKTEMRPGQDVRIGKSLEEIISASPAQRTQPTNGTSQKSANEGKEL